MIKPLQQILPPASGFGRRRPGRGADSRAVMIGGGQAQAGVRDALFVHMGAENAATGGSMGFIAQHLDQEWMHRKPFIDPRTASRAYRRARNIRIQRPDLLPPI
jgi:hypothetical protein